MKQLLPFFIVSLFMILPSCSSDDDIQIVDSFDASINLKATYNGQPLVIGNTYTYENDLPIFFTQLKFYLSNIVLIQEDGQQVELAEVEVVNFTNVNGNEAMASQGLDLGFSSIPEGEYVAIEFGVGVAPDLNNTEPSDYSSSHPLGETADYWSAWDSYIFTKIEGKADPSQNGSFDLGFVYHIGSDQFYRSIKLSQAISISTENQDLPSIEIDFYKLLARSSTDFMDIETNSAVHNELDLMSYVMDNFENAVALQ